MKIEMSVLDVLESAFCEAALSGEPILVAKRDGFQFTYDYIRDLELTPEEVQKGLVHATIALEHAVAILLLFVKDGTEEKFLKNFTYRAAEEARHLSAALPLVQIIGAEKALEMIKERGEEERGKGKAP
jgi:hypothetical protein